MVPLKDALVAFVTVFFTRVMLKLPVAPANRPVPPVMIPLGITYGASPDFGPPFARYITRLKASPYSAPMTVANHHRAVAAKKNLLEAQRVCPSTWRQKGSAICMALDRMISHLL